MPSDIIQEAFGSWNAARNISRLDFYLSGFQKKVEIKLIHVFSDENFNLVKVIRNYSPDVSQFSW